MTLISEDMQNIMSREISREVRAESLERTVQVWPCKNFDKSWRVVHMNEHWQLTIFICNKNWRVYGN